MHSLFAMIVRAGLGVNLMLCRQTSHGFGQQILNRRLRQMMLTSQYNIMFLLVRYTLCSHYSSFALTRKGTMHLDMTTSYSATGDLSTAEVSSQRISIPHEPTKKHKHNPFGLVSIHGFLLSTSFFLLSIGVLAIRSGLSKSFKLHWTIQAVASGAIVVGCLIGLKVSLSHGHFNTFHQILGLFFLPTMILQALFGYWHHLNFKKIGKRTAISHYYVWLGRATILAGNVNVLL